MKVSGTHDRDGYVEVRAEGPYVSTDLEGLVVAALAAATRNGGSRLLINMLDVANGELMIVDRYQMGTAAARIPKGVRLAVLLRPEAADPERFGIQVARNRGAVIDLFHDEKPALAWLLRKDDPAPPAKPT